MKAHEKRLKVGEVARGIPRSLALVLVAALGTGCDDLFSVANPTDLLDEDLDSEQLIDALGNSAEASLAGGYDNVVVFGEMMGDQVFHWSSQDFGINIDQGFVDIDNVQIEDAWNSLASARWTADDMVRRLEDMVDDPGSHLGVANSYFWGGLARVALANLFVEVVYDAGAPITPAQALRDAIDRFDRAAQIASAAGDLNLAAGARGAIARAYRALYFEELHNGSGADPALFQQAEAQARQALELRPDFVVNLRYGEPGTANPLYNALFVGHRHAMAPSYAYRRDPVSGQLDPRIQHTALADVGLRGDSVYLQTKWTSVSDPVAVSRAAEAELVIAEARLMSDDLAGAVAWINEVRSRSDLPPFPVGDREVTFEQLLYERDTELWLEGRHWPDQRYYEIIPYRWAEVNKEKGVHVRWPVSVQEQGSNANYGSG